MMRRMSFSEIQQCELEIFKYFVEVCEKYELRYYLAGGTLLGAIRHKGFIPWDDDIDVLMPRPDFDKLYEVISREKHERYFYASNMNNNLNYPFAKIFDSCTNVKKVYDDDETEKNLWIDIFPLDGLPDNDNEVKRIFAKSLKMRDILKIQKSVDGFAKSGLKLVLKPLLKRILLLCVGVKKAVDNIDKFARSFGFDDYKYIGGIVWGYGPQERMLKDDYLKVEKVDFEGMKVNAPGCWDKYLTCLYGDYMKLPPENKRVTHDMEVWINE